MEMDKYQEQIKKYDTFSKCDLNEVGFIEKVLGLSGEAGEFTDKFKKILRDKNGVMTSEDKDAMVKELGDVLWYIASLSRYMDVSLSEVASRNIEKLKGRLERGTVHGSGDDR